ncbi:MAG: hypothetical protein QM534_16445 [Sediminibacterium sp.]|nr:hypothetical protein [Sediminibacterium sp.]
MKAPLLLLMIAFTLSDYGQSSDPTLLWIFRMEQNARESVLFENFQGSSKGYPNSTGLFKSNDTIRYASGLVFRTCEVSNQQLNGNYKMYFPNGKLYMKCFYKKNQLVDSTSIYNETGKLVSIIRHLSPSIEQEVHFDLNGTIKKVEDIQIVPVSSTTFKSGYVHTNTDKVRKTVYYNPQGQPIDKEAYLKLYPNEK